MNVKENVAFDLVTQKNIELWLDGHYDEKTKSKIRQLLIEDPKQVIDAFFTHLTFGTAGLRGLMGVGTNRMNVYTVRAATQGLANYIQKQPRTDNSHHSFFIGYDSRYQSREFAEETAKVMAGNGIYVYLFSDIRPTPLVSFGCRYKKCLSAVMITASHNPPDYNGYKVYWSDGGQIVPPHDAGIIAEVAKVTDPSMVRSVDSIYHPLIEIIETEVDQAYLKTINPLQNYAAINKQEGHRLRPVYTSLHGTGIKLMPQALASWGFTNPLFVDSQIIPDGSFPTVKLPNPEEKETLQLGIQKMLETKSDLLIATDPDADRVGVAVYHKGQASLLSGNQIAVLCLAHICEALSNQKKLSKNAAFIKSMATTEMFTTICQAYQYHSFNVLPGFKYIAEMIQEWELQGNEYQFIFGGEESYGYLLGTHARDKDAIVCSALICEAALQAKLKGKTLIDQLYMLYQKYGLYQEKLLSINFGETKEGKEQMSLGMKRLRDSILTEINKIQVQAIEDYMASTKFYLASGQTEPINLPPSNILVYWLSDGTKVIVRPSGTEPKVKLYCSVADNHFSSIEEGIEKSSQKCMAILTDLKNKLIG